MRVQLSPGARVKADADLRVALERAAPAEAMRVVVTLRAAEGAAGGTAPDATPPKSRAAFRQAKIAKLAADVSGIVKAAKAQLGELPLKAQGGDLIPVLVIEGPAEALAKALELDAIAAATLDREVALVQPRR